MMTTDEYRIVRRPNVGELVTRGKQYVGSGKWSGAARKVRVLGPCGADDYYVTFDLSSPTNQADWDEIVHIQSLVGCHTFARE